MWKDYSRASIRSNKAASISIAAATLIAALFLSLICSLFYNIWYDDVERIVADEGDWHGRIVGEFQEKDLELLNHFANVSKINVVDPAVSNPDSNTAGLEVRTIEIYFENKRDTFRDMQKIAAELGVPDTAVSCNVRLLSQYLIYDPQDDEPPLLFRFHLAVVLVTCIALILIIHNAFAVSMTARIHQLGILSSIGATPGQIRLCLMQEAAALCLVPVSAGIAGGTGLCVLLIRGANQISRNFQPKPMVFHYHLLVFVVTAAAAGLTVLVSAWLPARSISRMTPLEAIRSIPDHQLKRKKRFSLLAVCFGMEGELARNALLARKKALRTSSISLTLSLLAFTVFLCFWTLSGISTRYTYFERYKDSWDIMADIKDTSPEDISRFTELAAIEGISSCVMYQKAAAYTPLSEDLLAPELKALGGLAAVAGPDVRQEGGLWMVRVPIIILDDAGYRAYCEQTGMECGDLTAEGIVINRIWDRLNSVFRYPEYIPFINEQMKSLQLTNADGSQVFSDTPVSRYTDRLPLLREEYDDFTLVQVLPWSTWTGLAEQTHDIGPDTRLRVLVADKTRVDEVEKEIKNILDGTFEYEIENRIREAQTEAEIRNAFKLFVGILCGILALIGITNIVAGTLGFLYQRKREFARYLSVGMTPDGIRKMLWIEAFAITGRPVLITIPLAVGFVLFAVKASYLDLSEFIAEFSVMPVAVFILVMATSVGLAYYLGIRRIMSGSLSEALRNDAMI